MGRCRRSRANAAQRLCDSSWHRASAASKSFAIRRARHEQVGEIDRRSYPALGGHSTGHSAILRGTPCVGIRDAVTPDLARVELRASCLSTFSDIPDHGVGLKRRAVMECHARAQLELHFFLSASSTFHRSRAGITTLGLSAEVRSTWSAVIHGGAGERASNLDRLAQCAWNVGGRHTNCGAIVSAPAICGHAASTQSPAR